jgi:hypothetical protein
LVKTTRCHQDARIFQGGTRERPCRGLENSIVGDRRSSGVALEIDTGNGRRRIEEVEDIVVVDEIAGVVVWTG